MNETSWSQSESDQEDREIEEDIEDFYHHTELFNCPFSELKDNNTFMILSSGNLYLKILSPPPELG